METIKIPTTIFKSSQDREIIEKLLVKFLSPGYISGGIKIETQILSAINKNIQSRNCDECEV